MTLIEIVALIGFILGAILHTVLSVLIIQRRNKKGSELIFLFLVISVAMWHYGNVISLFSVMLFGKNIPVINQSSDVVACFGMGIIPSLLLHASLLFSFRKWLEDKEENHANHGYFNLSSCYSAFIYGR